MAVIPDTLEGSSHRRSAAGDEFVRGFVVTDLSGVGAARLVNAVDQVVALIGNIGAAHPVRPNARLVDFDAPRLLSDTQARVVARYRERDDESVIQVGASLMQAETNRDRNGTLLVVEYKGKQQGGTVTAFRPQTTVVIERSESASPGNKAKEFVGAVNDGSWEIDPSADPRTWMCTSIVGRSSDGGATYDVRYEFAYMPQTWDQTLAYLDPDTGRPPPDVEPGDGLETVEVAPGGDFNDLALLSP